MLSAAVLIGAVRVKGLGFDTRLEGNAADCNWYQNQIRDSS